MEEIIKKTIIKMVAEEFKTKVIDNKFMKELQTIYDEEDSYYKSEDRWMDDVPFGHGSLQLTLFAYVRVTHYEQKELKMREC